MADVTRALAAVVESNLRIFDCVAYTKICVTHLKKLDEKSKCDNFCVLDIRSSGEAMRRFCENWAESKKKAFTGYAKKSEVFNRFKRLKETIRTFLTDGGGEFTSVKFYLLCEESGFETMADELESITRNKTWMLVDRPAGVKHTWVCDTMMEVCNTTRLPMETSLKILEAKDEPEINAPGVEQKADILTKPLARIKFKQMRSLIGVQEIDLPNSSWN